MKQRLFSWLCPPRFLGEHEDQALGHNILAVVVWESGKIRGPVPKEAQPVRLWLCRHAHVWVVRKFINFENSYWFWCLFLEIIGGSESLRSHPNLWMETCEELKLNYWCWCWKLLKDISHSWFPSVFSICPRSEAASKNISQPFWGCRLSGGSNCDRRSSGISALILY